MLSVTLQSDITAQEQPWAIHKEMAWLCLNKTLIEKKKNPGGDLDLALRPELSNPCSGYLISTMGTDIKHHLMLSTAEQIRQLNKWGNVSTSKMVRQE